MPFKKSKTHPDASSVRLMWRLIESLTLFTELRRPGSLFYSPHSADLVILAANSVFAAYNRYFCCYFDRNPQISVSVSYYHWNPPSCNDTYMFVAAHYIDPQFRLCEVPLTLFGFTEKSLASMMVRNTVMDWLGPRIRLVVSSYVFLSENLDVLRFAAESRGATISCLPCVASFTFTALDTLLVETLQLLGIPPGNTLVTLLPPELMVGALVYTRCSQAARALRAAPILFAPGDNDPNGLHYSVLVSRADSFAFLASALVYRSHLEEVLADNEWRAVVFAVVLEKFLLPFVAVFFSPNGPSVHMVLKWLMVMIVKLAKVARSLNTQVPEAARPVAKAIDLLKSVHLQYESTFDVLLASYLHPSTRSYLQERHLVAIHQYIESRSQQIEPADLTWSSDTGDNLDDAVMRNFNCYGSTGECHRFETDGSAFQLTKSGDYKRDSTNGNYLARESGTRILDYWKDHNQTFPQLAQQALRVLCMPTNTNRDYDGFQVAFEYFMASLPPAQQEMVDPQTIYVLHRLSKLYDVARFDPTDVDSDIQEYQLNCCETESPEDAGKNDSRKHPSPN